MSQGKMIQECEVDTISLASMSILRCNQVFQYGLVYFEGGMQLPIINMISSVCVM